MSEFNYDEEVLKTLSTQLTILDNDLLHAVIGITTEAGELLDAVKKNMFYGKPLDQTNLIEELGDLEWYMSVARNCLGVTQQQVQEINVNKLRARYTKGTFTSEDAIDRNLDTERKTLEG